MSTPFKNITGNKILNNIKQFHKKYTLLSQLMILSSIGLLYSFFGCVSGRPSFLTIIFQIYILYFSGKYIFDRFGSKKLLTIFGYSSIITGLGYLLLMGPLGLPFIVTSILPIVIFSGVMSIFVAMGTMIPNQELLMFGIVNVKFKWLVIGFIVLAIIGNYFTLIGAVFGFVSIYIHKQNNKKVKKEEFKQKINFRSKTNKTKYKKYKTPQSEIDTILDKISKNGYTSLNKKDKETLFNLKK